MSAFDLILASASPRRAALLRDAGLAFEAVEADVDESLFLGESPDAYVLRVARDKAAAIACRKSGNPVLAADTAVVADGAILGKPADDRDARHMLERLSGRVHLVLTGVVLFAGNREYAQVVRTRVHFLPISTDEIDWYLASGEPRGKAGAYAIQGLASRFVDWIDGSYSNVVGLPVATVCQMLRQAGLSGYSGGVAAPDKSL
jgi:septum formation protein